jgi:hypothetical protein
MTYIYIERATFTTSNVKVALSNVFADGGFDYKSALVHINFTHPTLINKKIDKKLLPKNKASRRVGENGKNSLNLR